MVSMSLKDIERLVYCCSRNPT